MSQPSSRSSGTGRRQAVQFAVAALLLVAFAVGGYVLGSSSTASDAEAANARISAFQNARSKAQANAFRRSSAKGSREGIDAGKRSAQKSGLARGTENGSAAVEAEFASIAAAEAEAEAQERAENCGAPLFTEGYCPTDAEIEQENQAESEAGFGE